MAKVTGEEVLDLAWNPGSSAVETTLLHIWLLLWPCQLPLSPLSGSCHPESKMPGSLLPLGHSSCCSWNAPPSTLCPANSCLSFRSPLGLPFFQEPSLIPHLPPPQKVQPRHLLSNPTSSGSPPLEHPS